MRDFFSMLPPSLILKFNASANWVRIRKDTWPPDVYSTVLFRGVHDYQSIGSDSYQAVLIDEAAEVPDEAARYLLTRLRWKLPKSVMRVLGRQCRQVAETSLGVWDSCGWIAPEEGIPCPKHGDEWISATEIPYFFAATSNPFPGWFASWFHKRELRTVVDALGGDGVRVEFVRSLMRDNHHLPSHYAALNTAGLTPEERRRFIDGDFDVFAGLVYEGFDKGTHAWYGPIPKYKRVVGGLDFGQESHTAHFTAGVILLVTETNRLLLVDEFKDRGPEVYERMGEWMVEMEKKWGTPIKRKIEWRGDKSQSVGIKAMKRDGFRISLSESGPDSVDSGIRVVASYLNKRQDGWPGFLYLPDGHEVGGCPRFEEEIKEYVRDPKTLKVREDNDDILDSLRYAVSLARSAIGDPAQFVQNQLPSMS